MPEQKISIKLQAELLRAIRGRLSSSAFSAKLGYKFNQVARWEKGERRLLWTDFVAICDARRLPLAQQLELYLGFSGDANATSPLTKTLIGGRRIEEVAKVANLSRSIVSRWLNGKAPPTFLDVFALLGTTVNSIAFFEPLADLTQVPSLAGAYGAFRHQRELAWSLPWLDALMEALLMQSYQEAQSHDIEALGRAAGLPVATVRAALEKLTTAGMVEKIGGKFRALEIGIDYRGDKQRMAKNVLHWLGQTARAVECLPQKPLEGGLVGFSVMSLSRSGHERALKLFREFSRSLHELGTNDMGPKEKVVVQVGSLMDAASFMGQDDA